MKFWKSFSKAAVLKQLFFVLALFAVLIPIAIWDSNTQISTEFGADNVSIRSDKYTITIPYSDIAAAELTDLAEPGEKMTEGFDNDIIRVGLWKNDVWGEYYINADLDTTNCILVTLNDGRKFVFSKKDDRATEKMYTQLLTYLK